MGWKTPITLLVLLGVLMGAAYYGWTTVIAPATGDDSRTTKTHHHHHHKRTSTCHKSTVYKKGFTVKAKDIRVNVYNAGSRTGLAGDTMSALHDKGFHQGSVDNAPLGVTANNVTILTSDQRLPQVQLVASQFRGLVKYLQAPSIAPGVDVIVGDNFVGIDPTAKKYLRLHHATKVCLDTGR